MWHRSLRESDACSDVFIYLLYVHNFSEQHERKTTIFDEKGVLLYVID